MRKPLKMKVIREVKTVFEVILRGKVSEDIITEQGWRGIRGRTR